MDNESFLTDELEALPAGPELAGRLSRLDRSTLTRDDAISVMQARLRLRTHIEGELLRDMIDVAHLEPSVEPKRSRKPIEFAEVEIATALTWTRRAAMKQLQLALDLQKRLPNVLQAMCEGLIDYPKVLVFADVTTPVDDADEVRRIVDQVLPTAPEMNTTRIRLRLRRLIEEVDPDAAKRRVETSTKGRRIASGADSNGTAWLSALGLPIEKVAAAMERVDAMARAARNNGDPRTLAQLRADMAVDLMIGAYDGPAPIHRKGVVELTVPLTTLMGLSSLPGELAGWAPVCADIARQTAEQMRGEAIHTFVVHDGEGSVVAGGATRRRPPDATDLVPSGPTGERGSASGHVKAMADRKHDGAHNRPKAVAGSGESSPADNPSSDHLARPVTTGPANRSPEVPEHTAAGYGRRADAKPAKSNTAATGSTSSRRPTASMVAHIRARLDRCVFPGCNEPSSRCQVDHTQRWSDGGETEIHNLHPICVLCRARHKTHYAEQWIMPRSVVRLLGCGVSVVVSAA